MNIIFQQLKHDIYIQHEHQLSINKIAKFKDRHIMDWVLSFESFHKVFAN